MSSAQYFSSSTNNSPGLNLNIHPYSLRHFGCGIDTTMTNSRSRSSHLGRCKHRNVIVDEYPSGCYWKNIPKGGSTSRELNHHEEQHQQQQQEQPQQVNELTKGSMVKGGATGVKVGSNNSSIVQEAAKGLASASPLRISTSQMGNEIITDKISEKKRLSVRERRRKWVARRKEKRQERQSHKKHAMKLKNRNNLNIGRKVLHAGFGFFFATLNQLIPKETFVPAMIVITTGTLVIESLRYRKGFGWMNDVMCFILGGTLRKHEMEGKFTGSFYYFLGVTITAACFPKSCASLGICQLALADPSASYFGRQTRHVYWSRIENGFFGIGRNKGILGFLGGALTCLPFNYYVLSIAKIHSGGSLVTRASIAAASFALGLAGSFADLCVPTPALTMPKKILGVPMLPFHVDDNVVVPIFSGFACQKIFEMLGWTGGVDLAKFLIV